MAARLADKVALVTGGSSGIGRATAVAMAREGARVVVAARRVSESEETVQMITAQGREGLFVQTDVTRAPEVEALVAATVQRFGRLDCAFNNAGVGGAGTVLTEDLTEENFLRVLTMNLTSVWLCMKYELRQMHRQGRGAIVNNASTAGLFGGGTGSDYAASKHGVVGLTRAAAREYGKLGVRVNVVCPGFTRTPMVDELLQKDPTIEKKIATFYPMGRIGTPEEVAEAVVWLCSDAASFTTGHALPLEGGLFA